MNGDRGHDKGPVRAGLRRGLKQRQTGQSRPPEDRDRTIGVIRLRPEEPAQFNPDMLEALCQRIGEARAEAEVARSLQRISTTLSALESLAVDADPSLMAATLRSLLRDADMIGMTSLARVSRSVLSCMGAGDTLGYAATLARLSRVGERSMHAVWELEDLSG